MHLEHDIVGSEHEHSHSHTHDHTHEHTHADGETHCHEHTHEHTHSHEHGEGHTHDHEYTHGHAHEHGCSHEHGHHHHHDHDHSHGEADTRLFALMSYMAGHNADHTKELAELAVQLKDSGNESAYNKVMAAVEEFGKGNALLAEALQELGK